MEKETKVNTSETNTSETNTSETNTSETNTFKDQIKLDTTTDDELDSTIQVYRSYQYDKFVFLPENRPIIPSLVARVIASMQKKLNFDYITVTNNTKHVKQGELGVVDGQHRLMARKYLELPILYTINTNYDVRLIIGKNTHKAWTDMDFINCFAKMGDENYNKILTLKEMYPDFVSSRLYVLLAVNKFHNKKARIDIREGEFRVNNWDLTIKTANMLMDFEFLKKSRNPAWGQLGFFMSLMKIFPLEKYNHDNMIKKMQLYSSQLTRCLNNKMYLQNLSQIYNVGLARGKQIHFELEV